jgi:hypothetical protein
MDKHHRVGRLGRAAEEKNENNILDFINLIHISGLRFLTECEEF